LQASLPALRTDLERREREVERLRAEVARVQGLADQARASIDSAEKRLAELVAADP
jgi:septal ring factor EnvC (AmiA/AmiB activator)